MNAAFRRAHAVDSLESLSTVIVTHLVLITHFPDNQAVNHWNVEINGFAKTLRKFDKGKGSKHNFSVEYIAKVLTDSFSEFEEKETIVTFIESSKNMPVGEVDDINWSEVEKQVLLFAESVMQKQ